MTGHRHYELDPHPELRCRCVSCPKAIKGWPPAALFRCENPAVKDGLCEHCYTEHNPCGPECCWSGNNRQSTVASLAEPCLLPVNESTNYSEGYTKGYQDAIQAMKGRINA